MSYSVELTDRARKQYTALDRAVRERVRMALEKLSDDPAPPAVKALSGSDGLLRIRVGDWRIIYRVEHDQMRIVVMDMGHRSAIYRHR